MVILLFLHEYSFKKQMENMRKGNFSEFLSELIVLADEVASFAKDCEIETNVFTEFAMLVEKFEPIFRALRDKSTLMDKPSIRKSLESLENELRRAIALTNNPNLKHPIKQIEDMTHDLGRSLGLLLVSTLELSPDFREMIGALQRELMNARFGGVTSPTSNPSSESVSDVKLEGEIEEEAVNFTIDDFVLQLKHGNDKEFAVALMRLKEFFRGELADSGLINEEALVAILSNRLGSSKADSRLSIIQLLRRIALNNERKVRFCI